MSTKDGSKSYRAHVVVLPFHGQGHMNPMLQFSKRLASKGLKVTVATTLSTIKTLSHQPHHASISLEPIFDDSADAGMRGPGGFQGFTQRFEESASRMLMELVNRHVTSDCPVTCLVYDANLPWCLRVARGLGILAAGFFTQSCAAIASYLQMRQEMLSESSSEEERRSSAPAIPLPGGNSGKLWRSDTKTATERFPPFLRYILEQLGDVDQADWVLFNSFDKLEEEVSGLLFGFLR